MIITGKTIGSRRPLFADWSIPISPDQGEDDDGGLTLAMLIERIVHEQVALFRKRQHDRQFLRALSAAEIAESAERGKVEMGGSEMEIQNVDEESAVANALQSFEDGLYLVSIDDVQQHRLEQQVYLHDDSRITFIRLTMLTGG